MSSLWALVAKFVCFDLPIKCFINFCRGKSPSRSTSKIRLEQSPMDKKSKY